MDEHTFVQTLEAVLTPDTNVVKQATTKLREEYFKNPQALPLLIHIVRQHGNEHVRQLAAVEARSLVPKFWGKDNAPSKIPDDVKSQIRDSLLQSSTQDASSVVRHSAARVVATIAKIDLPQGSWLDLTTIVSQAAQSEKPEDREVGTYLIYTMLETLAEIVSDRWRDFLTLFSRTIVDPQSPIVRINTLLALGRIAEVIDSEETPEAVAMFRELIPHMVEVLKSVAESNDEEKSNSAFEVFQTLLIADGALISSHFRDLVQFFSDLSVNKGLDDENRAKALSFLMSCLRYKKMKIQALKVGEALTLRCMELVTEFKDSEDPDDMTPSRTALGLLDFMAGALPPSQVVVPLLNVLPQYVNHQDPNFRRAGILALGYCVEGAPDFIVTQLNSIFPIVLNLLNDPVAFVRQSALHTVTQLADDLAEELGKEHQRLMPLLIRILETSDNTEMLCRACNAIDAVMIGVGKPDVDQYLPTLMPKLSTMFSQPDFKLKSAAVGGIGSAALAAEDSFIPYFPEVMSALSPYISIKDGEEQLDLRGVVVDCMGHIATAVGRGPFTPYVEPLMQSAKESLTLDNPRLRETAFLFFGTIARLYGEDFAAFLPIATEALFQSLEQEEVDDEFDGEIASKIISIGAEGGDKAAIDGAIVDIDEDDDEDDDDDIWESLATVNAIALEKEVACDTIGEILGNCGEAFLPYFEKAVTILAEKSEHMYEGVRRAAICTLWRAYASLWQVAEAKGMQKWQKGLPLKVEPTPELKKLGEVVTKCTFNNLSKEDDRVTVKDVLLNLSETLKLCGPALLADADGSNIVELATALVLVLQKQHPCQIDEDDLEEHDIETLESAEYDWAVIDAAMEVCLGLAEALGEQYAEVWKIVSPHVIKYASSQDSRERSTAVGVVAESVKHMGASVTPFTKKILQLLMHRLSDEDGDTKANSIYAIGVLAISSQDNAEIVGAYQKIFGKLERVLSGGETHQRVLDNTAGCVSRMVLAHADQVPLQELLNALVGLLPLKEDFEENEPVFDMLYALFDQQKPEVFNITQRLIPVFSVVLGNEPEGQLEPQTREKVIKLVQWVGQKEPSLLQGFPNLQNAQ
ncbi:putative importin beta-4 subunit [Ascodesmis nigricans]|uniref:Putative importin beta-4 subunit n=1 Tax=Ascodesmis nigricans TaxID=341454 RepID=A0A4S2MS25_9PEZI|nr:putative importin beta-4 subunit [Ascodesmis nigricans]